MGGKYEVRWAYKINGINDEFYETTYTNSWFTFMRLRMTRVVIYYKVYCM